MTGISSWAAERTVDARTAARLIGRAFPALRGLPVTPLAEGWDNTVHLVGGTWVFRFPRRAVALPGFGRELAVLPSLAPRVPLPVPVPEHVGTDDDPAAPWPFAGSRFLPGRELAEAGLDETARRPVAARLGAFLRALHDPAVRALVDGDLPVDPMGRGWPRARMTQTREVLDRLARTGTAPADPAVGALLADAERLGAPSGEPVLVHGDLHVRHVLVDAEGRPAGVLDWGDVCLAEPAVDLSIGYAAFTGEARRAFLRAYGRVDAEQELRARALAVRLSALLADYAAAQGRSRLLAEARDGLRRATG